MITEASYYQANSVNKVGVLQSGPLTFLAIMAAMPNTNDQASAATKRKKAAKDETSNQSPSPDKPDQQSTPTESYQAELFPVSSNQQAPSKIQKEPPRKAHKAQSQREELLHPSAQEFKELYQLAQKIQEFKPWKFMEEEDVFGVQDPETGEIGFVSVMGLLGEYEAVAVFRGPEGLYAWADLKSHLQLDPNDEQAHQIFLEIPQFQLSFESGSDLDKRDREAIKSSGLKFGRKKPCFRSCRPGYLGWFLTKAEARQLIHTLAQLIDVAERFSSDESVIPLNVPPRENDFLIRVPESHGSELVWQDQIRTIEPPLETLVPFKVDDAVLKTLRALPKSGSLEIDLFPLPARVGGPNERPQLAYALLAADSASGLILGFELLAATGGVDLMYAEIPEKLSDMLRTHKSGPVDFLLRSERLADVLSSFVTDLGCNLFLNERLPAVEQAKVFMFKSMGMRP